MKKVQYLPEGPTNLRSFFPEVYFPDVEEWKVQAIDEADNIIMTTRLNKRDCCCDIRFHFINSAGCIEGINFRHSENYHETKSGVWEKPKGVTFDRKNGGRYRQDIKSDEIYEFETSYYLDSDLPFLKEFVNSPIIWIEFNIDNSNEKDYLPFVITESKIPQKSKDVYEYQIQLKGYLANQRINFR